MFVTWDSTNPALGSSTHVTLVSEHTCGYHMTITRVTAMCLRDINRMFSRLPVASSFKNIIRLLVVLSHRLPMYLSIDIRVETGL